MFSIVLLCLLFTPCLAKEKTDPFSKITVKSKKALFKKVKDEKSKFHLQYKGDVLVTFADSTTIKSDKLELFVQSSSDSNVEKIIFKDNVHVNRNNQEVWADNAEIIVPKKICELSGHVKIKQTKQKEKDIPLCTECERARIVWGKDEVELVGDDNKPVSTTIEFCSLGHILKKGK